MSSRGRLLLAARHRAGPLAFPLLEDWEQLVGTPHVGIERFLAPRIEDRAHLQVLEDGHAREDTPSLGRLREPEVHDLVRRHPADLAALETDRASRRPRTAADSHHQRRLAGAVGTDDGRNLPLRDVEVDALQRLDLSIIGLEAANLENVRAARAGASVAGTVIASLTRRPTARRRAIRTHYEISRSTSSTSSSSTPR
jgi:hypothetical protein